MVSGDPSRATSRIACRAAWLRRLRVAQWSHFLPLPLAAWGSAPTLESTLSLARGVATAFCVLAFGYLINAVADRHMDEPTKNPLVTEHARGVQLQIAGLACAAMAIAALGPPVALVATTVCLVSGTLYSVGLRLKAYPLLGTLLNATNFAPLLLVGTHDGVVPPRMGWLLIAFVGLLLQNQLLHEAADSLEDARGQLATTARTLGPIKTGYAAALLGATVPAVLLRGGYGALGSMSALVFVVLFPATVARYGLDANRMGWARRAHRWASLATGAVVFAVAPAG